ncbi:MAG: DEAD/DEAH box helicase [Tepidisphaeraceae bacterium]
MSDKTEHPPLPEAFAALGVRNSILKGLAEINFTTPSEIQQLLIPVALTGVDILGQARTGTGKTAAFGIPVLCRVERQVPVQCLILTPTRELAVQVSEDLKRFAKHTPIKVVSVYGGQKIQGDIKALHGKPEIVVGTPGRVIDLLDRRLLTLENIRFIVLDEVDRMLDIGFREDIRNILSRLKGMRRQAAQPSADEVKAPEGEPSVEQAGDTEEPLPPMPTGHQTIFVSATFTEEIERLARRYMKEPVEKLVAPGADEKPTVEKVEQFYLSAEPWDKHKLLRLLLEREKPELAIIFCRTKHGAEKLGKNLTHDGFSCREIHGNLAQNKRDSVMKGFKHGKFNILVATDLASRGIDVSGVTHVINYDIPEDPDIYVHRVGRTARMGTTGKAYTFVTREQGDELTRIENVINMVIPVEKVDGFVPRPPPEKAPAFVSPPKSEAEAPKPPEPDKNTMRLGAKLPARRRRR